MGDVRELMIIVGQRGTYSVIFVLAMMIARDIEAQGIE